jgi:NAD+ kinase
MKIQVYIYDPNNNIAKKQLHIDPNIEVVTSIYKCEKIIAIGGDGTFLHAFRMMADYKILDTHVLYGLNAGTVGFLTNEIEVAFDGRRVFHIYPEMFDKNHQSRMLFDVFIDGTFRRSVLNEVSVHTLELGKLFTAKMTVFENHRTYGDSELTYKGDGLIISTPTGSTAYNISSGGPILEPFCDQMVITPISPFSLAARSIVLNTDKQLSIRFDTDSNKKAAVVCDGVRNDDAEEVHVEKSKLSLTMVQGVNFFTAIHKKLGWNNSIK